MSYTPYDHVRFVYETPIRLYGRDALQKAAEQACERAKRYCRAEDFAEHGWAYRVIDNSYSSLDEYEVAHSSTVLEIIAFPVIKVTPTGFRILRGGTAEQPETRFISLGWTKQWAARSPEEAVRSYVARRRKMARIHEGRAQTARYWADKAERLLAKDEVIA